jgi:hypothetical protein
MQGLLDVYNVAHRLKLTSVSLTLEPEINNYYGKLYSAK